MRNAFLSKVKLYQRKLIFRLNVIYMWCPLALFRSR